jgi:hypothetical protein
MFVRMSGNGTFVRICQGTVCLLEYVGERYICWNTSGNGTFVRICHKHTPICGTATGQLHTKETD